MASVSSWLRIDQAKGRSGPGRGAGLVILAATLVAEVEVAADPTIAVTRRVAAEKGVAARAEVAAGVTVKRTADPGTSHAAEVAVRNV